jgi:hypothetical protein
MMQLSSGDSLSTFDRSLRSQVWSKLNSPSRGVGVGLCNHERTQPQANTYCSLSDLWSSSGREVQA